jgi:hypothetical protein
MAPEIGKEHTLWAALGVVLDHAVRDPGAAFSIIAVFAGFLLFTDTHSWTYRWIASPIHGLTHLAALFFIGWAAAALTAPSGNPSVWQLLASVPLLFLGGYLGGALIMGLYLFVSLRLFRRHLNGLVTATIDEPRGGKVKSGFMLRRHLATAPPLRLGRSAAWAGRRGVVEG